MIAIRRGLALGRVIPARFLVLPPARLELKPKLYKVVAKEIEKMLEHHLMINGLEVQQVRC